MFNLLLMRHLPVVPAIICATLALAVSAPAAEAQVDRFQGGGIVFNFNQACRNVGWNRTSENYSVRYHPAGLGNNGNRESITFLQTGHSLSFVQYDGPFTTTFQPVDHGGSFQRPFYFAADAPNAAELRIGSREPANLTATHSGSVRLRGRIRNWGGSPGCVVHFDVVVGAVAVAQ